MLTENIGGLLEEKSIVLAPKNIKGSITIPEGITSIASYAFCDCKELEHIICPEGLLYIYEYAFTGCSHLKHIDVPDSLSSIGDLAFDACHSLKKISLPDKCTFSTGQFKTFGEDVKISIKRTKPRSAFEQYDIIDPDTLCFSWTYILNHLSSTMPSAIRPKLRKIKIESIKRNNVKVSIPDSLADFPTHVLKANLEREIYQSEGKHVNVEF